MSNQKIELTIKNYRCFPVTRPLKLTLEAGTTSFIGANNAGKSAVFRFLFEFRNLFTALSSPGPALTQAFQGGPFSFNFPKAVKDPTEVHSNLNTLDTEIQMKLDGFMPGGNPHIKAPSHLNIRVSRNAPPHVALFPGDVTQPVRSVGYAWEGDIMRVEGGQEAGRILFNYDIYRQALKLLGEICYIGHSRNVLDLTGNNDQYDCQIGKALISAWRQLRTDPRNNSGRMLALRITDDIARILGFRKLTIEEDPESSLLTLNIEDKPYTHEQIGSSFVQLFTILANVATRKVRPSFILIDEPEMNLHFSLQGRLVEALRELASEGVMFSTHSLTLARTFSDRTFVVRRLRDGESEVSDLHGNKDVTAILRELGYFGVREHGYEILLLVEGPTEQAALQELLKIYGKETRVFIWPLFGSTNINKDSPPRLKELTRLADRLVVLIDSERLVEDGPLPTDRKAFVDGCKEAEIQVQVLQLRALENYFTLRAIVDARLGQKALGPFEKFEETGGWWDKSENWRIARKMNKEDLVGTDLGEFLEKL